MNQRDTATTARDAWLELLDSVLRPARPDLLACRRQGEFHREARRLVARERAAALAGCVSRIEAARAAVITADDGAVPRLMTDLEREWRALARKDRDDGLMDLWARITPTSWHDRKRWRDSEPDAQLDAAVALASDVRGVEAAESAVAALRSALAAWGVDIGARVRWALAPGPSDADPVMGLLLQPLLTAEAALAKSRVEAVVRSRAEETCRLVREAARTRWPERPLLGEGLARAAYVDIHVRAAALAHRPNPVTPLVDLWRTGYAMTKAGAAGVTLEIPPTA